MKSGLQEAAQEITAILRKHDIAGVVIFGNKTHSDFVLELTPTWSCAKMEGEFLRIKCNSALYPDAAERKAVLERTAGMLMDVLDCKRSIDAGILSIVKVLDSKLGITHTATREQ